MNEINFWYKGECYVKSHGPVSKTVGKEKDRAFRVEVAVGKYKKKRASKGNSR